jgi:hypothetical protein
VRLHADSSKRRMDVISDPFATHLSFSLTAYYLHSRSLARVLHSPLLFSLHSHHF